MPWFRKSARNFRFAAVLRSSNPLLNVESFPPRTTVSAQSSARYITVLEVSRPGILKSLVSWGVGRRGQFRKIYEIVSDAFPPNDPTVSYLVNKPPQAAGMSADNVRGWEIVRKMNIWPKSEASRANVKFWEQSLSQGHYQPQPTYQPPEGFYSFYNPPLIFISQWTARKHGKKSHLWSDARDWREGAK